MEVVNWPAVISPLRVKRTVWLFVPGTTWAPVTDPNELPLRSRIRSPGCTVAGSTGLLKRRSTRVSGTATHGAGGDADTTVREGVVRSSSASGYKRALGRRLGEG